MLDRIALERRQDAGLAREAAAYAGGLALGLAIAAAVLVASGVPAKALGEELVVQVFLTATGLAQTATIAVPLVLVGLAAALAMRVRFWNIGLEGQLWLGAVGASGVALFDLGPEAVRLPVMLAAAAFLGAAWIALPLLFRLRLGVSEIVLTLLLSNVAFLFLQHLVFGAWHDPANNFPVSAPFDAAERLAKLGFGNLHAGLFVALAAAGLAAVLVGRTRLGFSAAAVGLNPVAARAAGLPVGATIAAMVLISGALAGLAGGVIVAGTEYRLTQYVGMNATFSGIVVAFVARFHPLGAIAAAAALAGLYNAGATLKVFYGLSDAVVVLIQGIVLTSLLVAQFFAAYRIEIAAGKPA